MYFGYNFGIKENKFPIFRNPAAHCYRRSAPPDAIPRFSFFFAIFATVRIR